jgi:hypothetical protein
MKVKHSVETEDVEADLLYNMVTAICLAPYPTVEEQNAAILAAKLEFKTKLDELVLKAFKVGCKIGKKKADITDAAMYDAGAVPPM